MLHHIVECVEPIHPLEGHGNGLVRVGHAELTVQLQQVIETVQQVNKESEVVDAEGLQEGAENFTARFLIDLCADLEVRSSHRIAHHEDCLLANVNVRGGAQGVNTVENVTLNETLHVRAGTSRDV